jgi:hypothetical protein
MEEITGPRQGGLSRMAATRLHAGAGGLGSLVGGWLA